MTAQLDTLERRARSLGLVLTPLKPAGCGCWRLVSLLCRDVCLSYCTTVEDLNEQLDLFERTDKLARDMWLLGVGMPEGQCISEGNE